MKILFVQISDMHCKGNDSNVNIKIDKVVTALREIGSFNKIVLIFSGDLTNRADKNEYKSARAVLGRLLSLLATEFQCGFINLLVVPGNHDIKLEEGCRDYDDIVKMDKDKNFNSELELMEDFFEYAESKGCFSDDKLADVRIISIDDKKIQVCLLNSAPFSTKSTNDKELHHFPEYVGEKIKREKDVDFKITVIHHSYEWFDWKTKEMLKSNLGSNDLIFFGHEHKGESFNINNHNGTKMNIIMGGEFSLSQLEHCAFNAALYDTKNSEIFVYQFNWDIENCLFKLEQKGNFEKVKTNLTPIEEYIDNLLEDKHQVSKRITDYYVFPKLRAKGEMFEDNPIENVSLNDVFNTLKQEKVIRIFGDTAVGKTTLLKYLYVKSLEFDFVPLLIEKRDYHDGRIDKMLKYMFERQYGEIEYSFYLQGDVEKQIVFIDDVDLIESDKARKNLVTYILDSGRLLVYSAQKYTRDLEEIVKDYFKDKTITSFEIPLFYKESRDVLVSKICDLKKQSKEDREAVCAALDYMAQSQSHLIILTPLSIINYINYFLKQGGKESKGIKTISLVFETNIRNAMLDCVSDINASIYLSALEFIANKMYFELRSENITMGQLTELIVAFNEKRKAKVSDRSFYDTCKKAQLIKDTDTLFGVCFCDKNTFAYFVAKSINRELERDLANQDSLKYVMNHICFGINDTIILFLSYIRGNTNVILNIAKTAVELLNEYPEWDFEKNNLPFLKQSSNMDAGIPTSKEKQDATNEIEKVERNTQENIKFRGVFDFNEEDVNKEQYKIARAWKYARLIGRSLIDQYGALDYDEIDEIVQALYCIPQKIIYAILSPYQQNYDYIVSDIKSFTQTLFPDKEVKDDDIKKALGEAGVILALDIMNDIAYNATNNSTIVALRDIKDLNSNYKIMQLIMEENTKNSPSFVNKAIELYKQNENNIFVKVLITQIARKHVFYSKEMDFKLLNKLTSNHILTEQNKKKLLMGQIKKNES